jgi:hypothetical protein
LLHVAHSFIRETFAALAFNVTPEKTESYSMVTDSITEKLLTVDMN